MKDTSVSRNALPDVAFDQADFARPLDWVGMAGMAMPIEVSEGVRVPAMVDVEVNLNDAEARGIHMSRLYLTLQSDVANGLFTTQRLSEVLADCVASQSGLANAARIQARFLHLIDRKALISQYSGWKQYPVRVRAVRKEAIEQFELRVDIDYSSTCPASAALSRQKNAEAFLKKFGDTPTDSHAISEWMRSSEGMAATPHAQRSRAEVTLTLNTCTSALPIEALIDIVEDALGTPVQTAVKREDEQAFAERNAQNLMFCEDASRRIAAALSHRTDLGCEFAVRVAHIESLHAHDAVASVRGKIIAK